MCCDLNLPNFSLGFQDVVTIDMLREAYPLLDIVDHNRRPKDSVSCINIEVRLCSVTDEFDVLPIVYILQIPPTKGLRPIDGMFPTQLNL